MSSGILAGNTLGAYLLQASLTPAAVATITTAEQTFTIGGSGLRVNDIVFVNPPSLVAGVSIATARVSASDTIAITFVNPTAGSVTPASGTYLIAVLRPEGLNPARVIGG